MMLAGGRSLEGNRSKSEWKQRVARIVAGVATSHVPAIGAALDNGKAGDAYWQPLFDGFEPSKKWIAELKPDVVILVYNDHASAFSLEMIPTFAHRLRRRVSRRPTKAGAAAGAGGAGPSRTRLAHRAVD